jgi:hypothetical protein
VIVVLLLDSTLESTKPTHSCPIVGKKNFRIVYLFRSKCLRTPNYGIHIMDLNLLKYKYLRADRGRVVRKHLLRCYAIPVSMIAMKSREKFRADGSRGEKMCKNCMKIVPLETEAAPVMRKIFPGRQ